MSENGWKGQSIFISSTFRDFMAERDYLRDIVFPQIEEEIKKYNRYLEPVDLRWGVETIDKENSEEKELQVLKVCLDEIDRCKPFIIVLLGDRYGWIPPESRMKAAVIEKGEEIETKDKSVTALEIEYGILNDKKQLKRCYFYFREPLPYDEMPTELVKVYNDDYENKGSYKKLQELKGKILKEVGKDRVKTYKAKWNNKTNRVTGLEEFGEMVKEDIIREIKDETRKSVSKVPKTWEEKESRLLEEFIENKAINFKGRKVLIEKLKKFTQSYNSENWAISIIGESGSGKSSLFSKLFKELRKENCVVLAHAAGISPKSNSIENMLDRWIYELSNYLNITVNQQNNKLVYDSCNSNIQGSLDNKNPFEEKKKKFEELLSRVSVKTRVICLIDALNQFERYSLNQFERTVVEKFLAWLPQVWPRNARLITTSIKEAQTEVLSTLKGVITLELESLNKEDAYEIIDRIYERYHKQRNEKIIKLLLEKKNSNGKRASESPLWLNIALEELMLLDQDDFDKLEKFQGTEEEKIQKLLEDTVKNLPSTIEGIYKYVIDRAAKKFGKEFTFAILKLISESRFGLRTKDLKAIIPNIIRKEWDDLQFANLRRYLRAHIVNKGEQELWDFTHDQFRLCMSKHYFTNIEEWKKYNKMILEYLEKLPVEDKLRQSELDYHHGNYWWNPIRDDIIELAYNKDIIMEQDWELAIAEFEFIDLVIELASDSKCPRQRFFLGTLYVFVGNLIATNDINKIEKLKIILKDAEKYNNRDINDWIIRSLHIIKNPDEYDINYWGVYSIYVWDYDKVGGLHLSERSKEKARCYYEEELKIAKKIFRNNPQNIDYKRNLKVSYDRLGDLYLREGEIKKAKGYYIKGLRIGKVIVKKDPENLEYKNDLSFSYNRLGDVYLREGNIEEATRYFEEGLYIAKEVVKKEPKFIWYKRDLKESYKKLANIYINKKLSLERGKYYLDIGLRITNELLTKDKDNLLYKSDLSDWYELKGDCLIKVKDMNNADIYYKKSYEIRKELLVTDTTNEYYKKQMEKIKNKISNLRS